MPPPRSKPQIHEKIKKSDSYRDEVEYIQSTLDQQKVFIGQLVKLQPDRTEVSYWVTVGMYQRQLPEVVLTGVPTPMVKPIVEELFEGLDFDRDFLAGKRTKTIYDLRVMALPLHDTEKHDVLAICRDVYTLNGENKLKAVQLIFADQEGRFPWSAEYAASERQYQPVLEMPPGAGRAN